MYHTHTHTQTATLDTSKFADYFFKAPMLDIPGRTFPVDIQYVECNRYVDRVMELVAQVPHFFFSFFYQTRKESKTIAGGFQKLMGSFCFFFVLNVPRPILFSSSLPMPIS